MEACTNPDVLRVLLFAKNIVSIIFTIIPIAIIIMAMIDFSKSVTSSSADEQRKKIKIIIKRTLYGIIVFSVPFIVKSIVKIIENTFGEPLNYNSCIENIDNIDYYQSIYDLEEEKRKNEQEEQMKRMLAEQKEKEDILKIVKTSEASDEQAAIGTRYQLSNDQLDFLATVAQKEQETVSGAIAESCLMANLFELKADKKKYGTGADGLYNYVTLGGWFGDAKEKVRKYLENNQLREEIKAAVKNVFVNGDRPYPIYMDEHDCWDCNNGKYCSGGFKGDICRIKNTDAEFSSLNQIRNRNNYKKDETRIYNVYGNGEYDYYTFYSFPASNSDPFGYTNSALNKFKSLNNGG